MWIVKVVPTFTNRRKTSGMIFVIFPYTFVYFLNVCRRQQRIKSMLPSFRVKTIFPQKLPELQIRPINPSHHSV